MTGPEFFQTRMGQRYFEVTMPEVAKQLERIAGALERQNMLASGSPNQKRAREMMHLLNRAAAALETPKDLNEEEKKHLIEDLLWEAKYIEEVLK